MDPLGTRLKRAREQLGLPLKEIAERTKISVTALEALERNDLSRLPGGIFGRAFVRAYAEELALDPEATVADFQTSLEEAERLAAERGTRRVEITDEDRAFLARQRRAVTALRIALIVILAAAVLYLLWRVGGGAPDDTVDRPAAGTAAP